MEDMELQEEKKGETGFRWKKELFGWLESIVISILAVALLITFAGRVVMVDGISMVDTLHHGERIVTTPLYTQLNRGDIVVVRRKDNGPIVKRVIGLEGETVDMDYANHRVLIDGVPLEEPYVGVLMEVPEYVQISFPVTVPEGYLFVMGDNRNHSNDSRAAEIGLVDIRNVFGKAVFRIWPLESMGTIE